MCFSRSSRPQLLFPPFQPPGSCEKLLSRLENAKGEIDSLIPAAESFILVDEQNLGHQIGGNRRVIPFREREGQYWGRPVNDDAAIGELERLRDTGAGFIAFAWPAFW